MVVKSGKITEASHTATEQSAEIVDDDYVADSFEVAWKSAARDAR